MDTLKDLDTKILMVFLMGYLEDGTVHVNLDGLIDVLSLRQRNGTVMGSSVEDSVGSCKISKGGKLDGGVDGKVNMSVMWVV